MLCNFEQLNIFKQKPMSIEEIDTFKTSRQHFSDCYLVSSLDSLSNSTNGRKIIQEQISYTDKGGKWLQCYLYAPDGKRERYIVPVSEVFRGYEKLYENQSNKFVRAVDISVAEYEKKYNSKPFFCSIADKFKDFGFEFNVPSHFMRSVTGVEPTVNIAEKDLNINLKSYKNQVLALFKQLEKEKNFSIVVGTGIKKVDGRRWHVYMLEDVSVSENKVVVKNKRGNILKTMTIDEFLADYKYIVGYKNEDLERAGL